MVWISQKHSGLVCRYEVVCNYSLCSRGIFQARKSVLLDLYTREDSHDGKSLVAYRKGDFKLISGSYKDPNWYYEPTEDHVNSSDTGIRPRIIGTNEKLYETVKYT